MQYCGSFEAQSLYAAVKSTVKLISRKGEKTEFLRLSVV